MAQRLIQRFGKHQAILAIALLIFLECILFIRNYVPGTFLIGWDNVFPELNLGYNLKMNLFSVWQEYRGLGVQDTMAHAANLGHTLLIGLLRILLPEDVTRYLFHSLMHLAGGMGMFILIHRTFKKSVFLALFGAMFYQYNMGTIQMFYAPFEAFSAHFAALPWLVYAVFTALDQRNFRSYTLLFIVSVLTTPQSLIPTLFIAYSAVLGSILLVFLLNKRREAIKPILLIGVITLTANAFWLFPFVHGALYQGKTVSQTKINQLSSPVIFERNNFRGTLLDVLTLRGFMLDTTEDDLEKNQVYIMREWIDHSNTPPIVILQLVFVGFMLFGVSKTGHDVMTKKTHAKELFLLPVFLFAFVMLGTRIPILGIISTLIRDHVPLFGEAFRFPFTKFILVFSLIYTVFAVRGFEIVLEMVSHASRFVERVKFLVPLAVLIIALPLFAGKMYYSVERLNIPKEYFDAIEFFKNEPPDRRVMTLPQTSFWNWLFYSWGARGSGFAWYGIPQAQLERPFDPWSNFNEQYTNELLFALQTEDAEQLARVISKYDISYILLDGYRGHNHKLQYEDKITPFIQKVFPDVSIHTFGKLIVYQLPVKEYVAIKHDLTQLGSQWKYNWNDIPYEEYGDYFYSADWDVAYLVPTLFTNKTQADLEFDFSIQKNALRITPHQSLSVPDVKAQYTLANEVSSQTDPLMLVHFSQIDDTLQIDSFPITISLGGQSTTQSEIVKESFALLPNDQLESVSVNGESIDLLQTPYAFIYKGANNTLTMRYVSGKLQTKEYIPAIATQQRSIEIEGKNSISISFEIPLVSEPNWQKNNIFEDKTYQIESPCIEQKYSQKSLYREQDNGVQLISQNSATCLHQYLDSFNQAYGLFLYANTNQTSGLPLNVVIDNPVTKSNFIETILDGKASEKILIIPPTSDYLYEDYGIHFRNISVSNSPSDHSLNELRSGYFPVSQLERLKIIRTPVQNQNTVTSSPVRYFKSNSSHYVVSYQGKVNNSVLYLSQSFHFGWKAYEIDCKFPNEGCLLERTFPFLFGEELTDQVMVNNWANGFLLRPDEIGTSEGQGNRTFIIIFWPQYLQFVGFGILGATVLLAGLLYLRDLRQKP